MRTDRCRQLMGVEIDDETMIGYLDRLGFQPSIQDGLVSTTVPVHRGDIEREVDLIEEVVRMHGFDAIDLPDDMRLRPASMPPAVDCWRAVSNVLVGCDFVESITHTLIGDRSHRLPEDGQTAMRVGKACVQVAIPVCAHRCWPVCFESEVQHGPGIEPCRCSNAVRRSTTMERGVWRRDRSVF